MPTSVDLVTDLPADFEVFGQAVATSMGDLLGGTTGQVLSKTSATDMDFTWTTPQVGDITGVTAGVGITGGGTSGTVTVTNDMATTITTNGDLLYGTGSGTYTRRGIGSTSQVLTVTGGVPTWATPASGALTYIGGVAFTTSAAVNVNDVFSATYANYLVIADYVGSGNLGMSCRLRVSAADNTTANYGNQQLNVSGTTVAGIRNSAQTAFNFTDANTDPSFANVYFSNPFATAKTLMQGVGLFAGGGANAENALEFGGFAATTSFTGFSIFPSSGTITGTIRVYGLANS